MMPFLARVLFYPTLVWNLVLSGLIKERRWWDQIAPKLWMGALPTEADVKSLFNLGVGAVINTCAEADGPQRGYATYGVEQFRLPIVDFTPPTLEEVEHGVAFIREQHAAGKGVYVHCKAGRGRSATLVMCWLIAEKRMTPEAAQQHLLQRRPHVNKKLYLRPVVRMYYAQQGKVEKKKT